MFFSSLKGNIFVKNFNMKKSAFISDVLFTTFLTALFTLCLFRYLKIGFWLAVSLSLVCGILSGASAFAYLQSKRKSLYLKRSDEAQKEKFLLHLALLSDEQKRKYFTPLLAEEDKPIHSFGKRCLINEDTFWKLQFTLSPVNADAIAAFSRIRSLKKKVVLCSKIDEDAFLLCRRLAIEVKTGDDVYRFVKAKNGLPEKFLGEENADKKTKRRFRLWFAKNNSRRFLVGGALVLVTSLITPFPYYYLILGSLLLLAALFIRVFGYE